MKYPLTIIVLPSHVRRCTTALRYKYIMASFKFCILIISMLISSSLIGQENSFPDYVGNYTYSDFDVEQNLELFQNGDFTYFRRSGLNFYTLRGKWELKKKSLILHLNIPSEHYVKENCDTCQDKVFIKVLNAFDSTEMSMVEYILYKSGNQVSYGIFHFSRFIDVQNTDSLALFQYGCYPYILSTNNIKNSIITFYLKDSSQQMIESPVVFKIRKKNLKLNKYISLIKQ